MYKDYPYQYFASLSNGKKLLLNVISQIEYLFARIKSTSAKVRNTLILLRTTDSALPPTC